MTNENAYKRFDEAVQTALRREKGMHGSVGTQNEKLIHAALKNYYAPFSDEQEIKIGNYYADAVCENGIFEIQTRALYRLKDKLKTFLEYSRVTVVHPVISEYKTVFINEESGEIASESAPRKCRSLLKVFEELYSIRNFLTEENLNIILAKLKIEKRVYFKGETPPNLSSRAARKRCFIEKVPLELSEELILETPYDYEVFLPLELPEKFTKKQLCAAARESCSSLRLEVLRETGIIEKTGKKGNSYLYSKGS